MLRGLGRARAATCAAATILLALTAVPAHAASLATGRVTLYSDTAYSRTTNSATYEACDNFIGRVPGQRVGSFDNAPLPGCRVVLHSLAGDYLLCAGRAVVPPAFRQVILYSIGTGSTTPCPV
ncbi:hypothetical protein [Nonomuraea zeae]|uniref:Uncharacterized protein n=1 Tax=Nonomuraea zeae TaxID=1642303 RepID=A0A5S4GE04_9ACTN|nr:hypothetical protein [Nonomuraea zeae]TMR31225.1 hypothetical protein ETD85_26570 [Nonomuraea zeae]